MLTTIGSLHIDDEIKQQLIDRTFKFLFCIKFDRAHVPNSYFLETVEQFNKVFGREGIQSMVLVVVLDGRPHNIKKFESVLYATSAYQYLLQQNEYEPIPFVLWHNFSYCFPKQIFYLKDALGRVGELVFSSERLQLIAEQVETLNDEKRARDGERASARLAEKSWDKMNDEMMGKFEISLEIEAKSERQVRMDVQNEIVEIQKDKG